MQEPREFLGALFESVKTSMRTPIVLDIYGDAVDMIAARDAEWQARVDKLVAALKNLVYTASKLWDDTKPIKDSEFVRVTHPIIEEARAALGREA